MYRLRLVAAFVLSPLVLVALVLGAVSMVLGNAWERAAYTKKQRRDHEIAATIHRLVRAGEGKK